MHTAVRARHIGDTVLYAGVFGSVPAGRYDLRVRQAPGAAHPTMEQTVTVPPGAVAETTLAANPPAHDPAT